MVKCIDGIDERQIDLVLNTTRYHIQMVCNVYGEFEDHFYLKRPVQVYEGWNVADQVLADFRGWGING